MATHIISTRLELDGEKAFKDGLSQISRESALLSAELRTLSADASANGSSVQNLAQQYSLMQDIAGKAQDRISVLNQAIASNQQEHQRLTQELATANQKYTESQQELERIKQAYGENSDEAKNAQKAMEENANAVKLVEQRLKENEKGLDNYKIKLANAETQLIRNNSALHSFEAENGIAVSSQQKLQQAVENSNRQSQLFNAQLEALTSGYGKNGSRLQNLAKQQEIYKNQVANSQNKVNALRETVSSSEQNYEHLRAELARTQVQFGENSAETQIASNALRQAESELTGYRTQLAQSETELNHNTQALANFNENSGKTKIGQIFTAVKSSLQDAQAALQVFENKFQLLTDILNVVYADLKKIGSVVVDVAKKAAEISFKAAEVSAKAFALTVETGMSAAFSAVKTYTTALAGAGTALGTWAVKTGATFDSAMSQVQATMGITKDSVSELNGENVNTFQALSGLAAEMGAETKYNATQAAEGINVLAMAGQSTEEIFSTLPSTLNLAAAGGLDIANAATITTGVMSGFKLEVEETAAVTDKIAMLASSAKGSVSDFGAGLAAVAGQASVTGQSIDDTATALGLLGNHNIAATEGGTMLQRVLKNLYQPTDTAKKALNELGVSAYDAFGNARHLQDVLQELKGKLGSLSEEDYNSVMGNIFDTAALRGAAFLIEDSGEEFDSLKNKIATASEAYDGLGAAQGQAMAQMDNLEGDITLLKSNVEGLAIDTSSKLNPALRKVVQTFNSLVTSFKNGGIEAVGKELAKIIPETLNQVSQNLPNLLKSATSLFNEIILTVANTAVQGLPVVTEIILPQMIQSTTDLITGLATLLPDFVPIVAEGAVTLFQGLMEGLNTVMDFLIPMLPQLVSGLADTLVSAVPTFFDSSLEFFESVITALSDVSEVLMPMLPELVNAVCDTLLANTDSIIDSGFDLLIGLADGLVKCVPVLLERLPEIITKISAKFTEYDNLKKLLDVGTELIVSLADGLPLAIKAIAENVNTVTVNIIDALMQVDWGQVGKDILEGILSGFLDMDFQMEEYLGDFADNWLTGIKDVFGIHSPSRLMRDEVGKYLALGVGDGFTATMKNVSDKMADSIPQNFATELNLDIGYRRAMALSDRYSNVSNDTRNYYMPINITLNAVLKSDSDIDRTAELLARRTQIILAGQGM